MRLISRTGTHLSYCVVTHIFHTIVTNFLLLYGVELWVLNFCSKTSDIYLFSKHNTEKCLSPEFIKDTKYSNMHINI
jgi:hypothetical protein